MGSNIRILFGQMTPMATRVGTVQQDPMAHCGNNMGEARVGTVQQDPMAHCGNNMGTTGPI